MMDGSVKARDLQRDPRMMLHNATVDKELREGDVRVSGRVVEVTEDENKRTFLRAFREANGYGPPDDSPMHLFEIDVTDVVAIQPGADHLVIQLVDTPSQGPAQGRAAVATFTHGCSAFGSMTTMPIDLQALVGSMPFAVTAGVELDRAETRSRGRTPRLVRRELHDRRRHAQRQAHRRPPRAPGAISPRS